MADQPSPLLFEDIPLDEARTMGQGPRMDPVLYQALKGKIQSLADTAVRMTIPPGASPTTMKNRIFRVAAELGVPVTIRRVPGGLIFWRSTDEDLHQAQEIAGRLQSARQPPRAARPARRQRR
jgi:precorrin-4 methylase